MLSFWKFLLWVISRPLSAFWAPPLPFDCEFQVFPKGYVLFPCHLAQPAPLAIPAAAAEQPARSPLLLLRALQGLLGGCRAGCLFTFFSMALPQPALPQRGKGALGSSLGTTLKAEFQGFPRTRLLLWPSYICDSRKVSLAKKPTYTFIVLLDKIPILHSVY